VCELCDAAGLMPSREELLRACSTLTECMSFLGMALNRNSPIFTSTPAKTSFMLSTNVTAARLAHSATMTESPPSSSPDGSKVEEYVRDIGDVTTWTAKTHGTKKRRFGS
jgi:hypothetical protein